MHAATDWSKVVRVEVSIDGAVAHAASSAESCRIPSYSASVLPNVKVCDTVCIGWIQSVSPRRYNRIGADNGATQAGGRVTVEVAMDGRLKIRVISRRLTGSRSEQLVDAEARVDAGNLR